MSVDMGQRLAPAKSGSLGIRVLSAAVLAPPALAALYVGPPYSSVLIVAAGLIGFWEWLRLCTGEHIGRGGWLALAFVAGALLAAAITEYHFAGWLSLLGVMAVLTLQRDESRVGTIWLALGTAYLPVACAAFLWLRADPEAGRTLILWLLFVVWTTDIAAYFSGRAIGGPKLAPHISPKKTWAGLIGGAIAAAVVGPLVLATTSGEMHVARWAAASATLAVVAQVGDLFESAFKRTFGAKEASGLIPGHGGLLDRIDGLLAAALVVAATLWLTGEGQ